MAGDSCSPGTFWGNILKLTLINFCRTMSCNTRWPIERRILYRFKTHNLGNTNGRHSHVNQIFETENTEIFCLSDLCVRSFLTFFAFSDASRICSVRCKLKLCLQASVNKAEVEKRYALSNSFQHFSSNSYILTDQYYHCLPSNAKILISHKCMPSHWWTNNDNL